MWLISVFSKNHLLNYKLDLPSHNYSMNNFKWFIICHIRYHELTNYPKNSHSTFKAFHLGLPSCICPILPIVVLTSCSHCQIEFLKVQLSYSGLSNPKAYNAYFNYSTVYWEGGNPGIHFQTCSLVSVWMKPIQISNKRRKLQWEKSDWFKRRNIP